jgi:hypothetical protein
MPKTPKTPDYPPIVCPPRPPEPPRRLLLTLSHVSSDAVATLAKGTPVILLLDSLPIWVATPLGLPIGQVGLDDVDAVRMRGSRHGAAFFVETEPPGCVIEVL